MTSEMRYYPYGQTRSGTMGTDRQYTGQRWEAGIGLYDYNARYYDPALGRFVQADTVVPSPHNSQSFNRYLYTLGNPLIYVDPSGHYAQIYEQYIGGHIAPPDYKKQDEMPGPPHVDGLPDEAWELKYYKNNGKGYYTNREDPSGAIYRPDFGYNNGYECEDPHWHKLLPGEKGNGEAFPSN